MPVTSALTETAYMNMRMALRDERKIGETDALLRTAKNLMQTLNLSAVQALQAMMIPEAEHDKYLKLLSKE